LLNFEEIMPYLKTPRGQFYYLKEGTVGPVVYLLHGLTSKCQDWETAPAELARQGFQVYAFDMRGHGLSEKPKTGYAPEDLSRDVEACANELDHQEIHVVGHSTGGRNALFFATMFSKKTLTLTIIDQTLTADPDSWKKLEANYNEYPTPFSDEASLDKFLLEKFPEKERRRRFEKGQFYKNEAGQWDWVFSVPAALEIQRLGRAQALHWLLKRTKCPVLFIKAADSLYVSSEEAEKISSLLEDPSRLVVIEKAGHGVFRDNPHAFLGTLVPFLQAYVLS
jgi:pimeloyl-ACP methyl ester carboxylesterase